ncbi:probable inactive receptor kinase At2g26730 [Actinidia eriantha]|uniref:probable inactive receptor kinase At2g26730 n=1 Tax=Actinidia eriantha TaxID=165200 RepID=UPI00258DADAC|nr:probable inactive receptor kinase At2g26730 [Actinidia eriantha]
MNQILIWVLFFSFFLITQTTKSDEAAVKDSLISFYRKLSNGNPDSVWNVSSSPCKDQWEGVICDNKTHSVRRIDLDASNFAGTFDPSILCNVQSLSSSLTSVSLNDNSLVGENLAEIANCKQLTRLQIGGNRFSGNLPDSFSRLNNLKRLNVSWNNFSGVLPDLARISGLQELLLQRNQLTGLIPGFDFPNIRQFNVSFNNFTGQIPNGGGRFPVSSFIGNPELCGDPLPTQCQFLALEPNHPNIKSKSLSGDQLLMYSGFFLVGVSLFFLVFFKLCKRKKKTEEKMDSANKVASADDNFYKQTSNTASGEPKTFVNKSDISASSSLIILTSPEVNGLRFDDLLRAPAELLGRGKNGTMYKVVCEQQGMVLAVKRVRDWVISSSDFRVRMKRLDQVRHPNVLSAMAFYYSKQEKLLVYEYQQNGSLFRLLHGTQKSRDFDWSTRLGLAATITNALAFMHQELDQDGIAHGNLKSSNILLNNNMEPCISEYGLFTVDTEDKPSISSSRSDSGPISAFKADVYGLGVILLELLTGKLGQNNGMGLAQWVLSVVREEWTVEVFDKNLIREGASEERMVNLLQIAVKCVDRATNSRPSINQVALMVNTIKEEEERSLVLET